MTKKDNTKKLGLLDADIDAHPNYSKKKIVYLTELKGKVSGFATKTKSDFAVQYPHTAKLFLEDEEIRVRLKQGLAWSKLFLKLFQKGFKLETGPGTFFTRSATHRALFYSLFAHALDRLLNAESRDQDPLAIGLEANEVETNMRVAEGKSIRHCQRIIKEALEFGFVRRATWRFDAREIRLWLCPEAMEPYLTLVLEELGGAHQSLPEARRDLLAAKEKNPGYDESVRSKLSIAIKKDQKGD